MPFQYDWYDLLRPYLDERNATAVGMVGTCWGSYLVTHVAAEDPVVKAGFSIHPSHVALMANLDEDETAIYEGIQERGSAQYFGNTPSETNNTAAGGLADSIIDKVFVSCCSFASLQHYNSCPNPNSILSQDYYDEFESPCDHGFFTRGDTEDPAVAACVDRAFATLVILFETFVY